MRSLVFSLVLAVGLAACGDSTVDGVENVAFDGASDGVDSGAQESGPLGDTVDAGTADLQRFDCQRINALKGEGPDIVGVTIGMSADTAFQKIACSNPALTVRFDTTGGFSVPDIPGEGAPRKMIVASGGQEDVEAVLVGKSGAERVVFLRRTVSFSDGQKPALTALSEQLKTKYGELIITSSFNGRVELGVLQTADKRPISVQDRGLINTCMPDVSGSFSLSESCGTSVGVRIVVPSDNAGLASSLSVAIGNGKYGMRLLAEYKDLVAQATAAKAEQEVKDAAGRTPSL